MLIIAYPHLSIGETVSHSFLFQWIGESSTSMILCSYPGKNTLSGHPYPPPPQPKNTLFGFNKRLKLKCSSSDRLLWHHKHLRPIHARHITTNTQKIDGYRKRRRVKNIHGISLIGILCSSLYYRVKYTPSVIKAFIYTLVFNSNPMWQ